MEYLDFELRVDAGTAAMYPISVTRSPAGEAGETAQILLDDPSLVAHLGTLEAARSAARKPRVAAIDMRQSQAVANPLANVRDAAEAVGRALFAALLPPQVLTCYRRSRDQASDEGKGLRLRLRIDAPELAVLPWEFLFDAADGDFLSLNRETPLTRYLELSAPAESLTVSQPIRILGMVASPNDQLALDVAQEQHHIEAAMAHLVASGAVELTWLEGQTWRALDAALSATGTQWHVFHFVGHGSFDAQRGEGLLVLADEEGNSHLLAARELGRLFARHPTLRLAVLNACDSARASETRLLSSTGAVLIQRGIPAVVSMQYPITDHAALEFTRNFYDALARKLPIDATVTEARYYLSMALPDSIEWATPVLYMHGGDGNLFAFAEPSAISSAAAPSEQAAEGTVASSALPIPPPDTAPGNPRSPSAPPPTRRHESCAPGSAAG